MKEPGNRLGKLLNHESLMVKRKFAERFPTDKVTEAEYGGRRHKESVGGIDRRYTGRQYKIERHKTT